MKKPFLIFTLSMLIGASGIAQRYASEADYMSKVYTNDKRTLMADYLKLTEEEGKKFWPLYDQYEKERSQMGEERYQGILNFVDKLETLSDQDADLIIASAFSFRKRYMVHLQQYTRRIEARVGAYKALQFYELESYFRADIKDRILSEVEFLTPDK